MDPSALTRAKDRLQATMASLPLSSWQTSGLITAVLGLAVFGTWRAGEFDSILHPKAKREASEPGLFKRYASLESFTTASGYTYPKIRVFYHQHAQIEAGKLPKDVPLLVFMHGLGGNATQFAPLLSSMVLTAPCLAIDLPGCGGSDLKPDDPKAYTTAAFAELLASAIDRYRDKENNQQVVLIGHSMGCSIAALLASSASSVQQRLNVNYIVGMVAICPRSGPPSEKEVAMARRLQSMPTVLFDLLRFIDRRGGLYSRSITRVVGEGADVETRRLQQKFNSQSKSTTFVRMLAGTLPSADGAETGWPGQEVWSGMKVPLFLVAGEADTLTSPKEVEQIAAWLTGQHNAAETTAPNAVADTEAERRLREVREIAPDEPAPESMNGAPTEENAVPATAGDVQLAQYRLSKDSPTSPTIPSSPSDAINDTQRPTKHNFVLKTTILPSPAAHGLLYTTASVRILSGLMENFFTSYIDERLSMGWQLQHLTTSGKWDVKNLKKWQSVPRCSEPIGGVFRAMKTMREVDEVHNPTQFVKEFSFKALPDGVAMIIDISHESPVYNPKGLEEGGVEYHKFPTVSKLPPSADEVEQFISLADQLRRSLPVKDGEGVRPTVGVHCHYGFNRTGEFHSCLGYFGEGWFFH
jgi:pimeloyl-ACP methyl ester carboxylesterase